MEVKKDLEGREGVCERIERAGETEIAGAEGPPQGVFGGGSPEPAAHARHSRNVFRRQLPEHCVHRQISQPLQTHLSLPQPDPPNTYVVYRVILIY